MEGTSSLFLFLAAAVIAVFSFLSIAVWVSVPAHERRARERTALLKSIAENPGENAARVLDMLLEEDRKREERRAREERQGYILGGLITMAVGMALSVLLAVQVGLPEATLGLIPLLIGVVLLGTGIVRSRDPRN